MLEAGNHTVGRRNFLYYATAGTAATVVGAGVWGLANSTMPDASALAVNKMSINLGSVPSGEQHVFKYSGSPIFVRQLTTQQMKSVADDDLTQLNDKLARNGNLDPSAHATTSNRTISQERVFVVVLGICTYRSCVPLVATGDYGGWFCPCCASHYDVLGRVRRGPAPKNLEIPRNVLAEQGELTLLPNSAYPSKERIQDLLFGRKHG